MLFDGSILAVDARFLGVDPMSLPVKLIAFASEGTFFVAEI